MNKVIIGIFGLALITGCLSREYHLLPATDKNPAADAVRGEGKWWMDRHRTIVSRLVKDPDLILIGNSIFHSLDDADRREVWERFLDKYRTVNMGISGDRTENVIWRIQHGALDNIKPKVAVLLIGTNNTDGNHYLSISTPAELAGGIWRICEIVSENLPDTKILIMGILPYGYKPNYRNNINKAANGLISKFPKKDPDIHYIDIGHVYLDNKGRVREALMPDFLHPNAKGHMLMFEALDGEIEKLMVE